MPRHILADKGKAFTAELLTELAKATDIHISHATIKHAQTKSMVERSHAKLKKILKTSVNAEDCNGIAMSALQSCPITRHTTIR